MKCSHYLPRCCHGRHADVRPWPQARHMCLFPSPPQRRMEWSGADILLPNRFHSLGLAPTQTQVVEEQTLFFFHMLITLSWMCWALLRFLHTFSVSRSVMAWPIYTPHDNNEPVESYFVGMNIRIGPGKRRDDLQSYGCTPVTRLLESLPGELLQSMARLAQEVGFACMKGGRRGSAHGQ